MLQARLKFFFFCSFLMVLMIAVPFADGEICPLTHNEKLRIIYNGGLNGKMAPCG